MPPRFGPSRREYGYEHGSPGSLGTPIDALIKLRQQLAESFRKSEAEWLKEIRRECELLKTKYKKFEREHETSYRTRLEEYVLDKKPKLKRAIESKVRLAGFVIGHSENKIVKEDIMPKIAYWHHRSGRHADFIFLGFSRDPQDSFDARGFAQIVGLFEREFDWKYSGQTDLIVLNIRYQSLHREVMLDTSDVVALVLEDAIADKAIKSVSSLIEDLIRVTQNSSGDSPSWNFSDRQGVRLSGSALKRLLLLSLPKSIREEARNAFYFHVKDLRKRKPDL